MSTTAHISHLLYFSTPQSVSNAYLKIKIHTLTHKDEKCKKNLLFMNIVHHLTNSISKTASSIETPL